MGCYQSKFVPCQSSTNIFPVSNIDESGSIKRRGHIQISNNKLAYFEENKKIEWHLFSLKRYGFDQCKFVIELGRRCPTGSGIYSFKTRKAEEIFNLLHEKVLELNSRKQSNNIDNHNNEDIIKQSCYGPPIAPRFDNSETPSYANLLLSADEDERNPKYIALDLNSAGEKNDKSETSGFNAEKLTYSIIDFPRTEALAKIVNDRTHFIQNST